MMDKQIKKLKNLVSRYLHQSKEELLKTWGSPLQKSDPYIWFYSKKEWLIFNEETIFIFDGDKVDDISINRYIFGIEYLSVFYYENGKTEYKVINHKLFP